MTDYYCDLAEATFADATGLDATANKYTGPAGLQAAIGGTGNATALVAGDVLYLEGTADQTRLIHLASTTGTTGWSVGDIVRDNNGGAEWTGILVEPDHRGSSDHWLIWLDAGFDLTDVINGSGINNVTQAETTALDAGERETLAIEIDNNSGGAGGLISCIGTTDLTDPLNNPGQAVLDAGGVATYGINVTAAVTEWHLEGIDCINATSNGFFANVAGARYWRLKRCRAYDNGGIGFSIGQLEYARLYQCVSSENTTHGVYFSNSASLIWCRIINNTSFGMNTTNRTTVIQSLIAGNSIGIGVISSCLVYGCTIDQNSNTGFSASTNDPGIGVLVSRISNNAAYGLGVADNESNPWEDYNVFHNNTSGDLLNTAGGTHSYGDDAAHIADPADDGYTARTILITFDGGTNMDDASVDDVVTDGTWSGKVRTIPTGAVTGTFECDTLTGGNPANNDAMTLGGVETGSVVGRPSVVFTGANATNYNVAAGKEIRSVGIDLFWDA